MPNPLDDLTGKNVLVGGVALPDRKVVEFVAGDGVDIEATDDSVNGRTVITVSADGAGPGAGADLADILGEGNETGGTDIVLSDGSQLRSKDGAAATDGEDIVVRAGDAEDGDGGDNIYRPGQSTNGANGIHRFQSADGTTVATIDDDGNFAIDQTISGGVVEAGDWCIGRGLKLVEQVSRPTAGDATHGVVWQRDDNALIHTDQTNTDREIITTAGTSLSKSGATLGVTAGGIGATQLATDAVVTAKIQDGAVTAAKLASGLIATSRMGDWCASQATASATLAYMNYQNPTSAASTSIQQVSQTCAGITGTVTRLTIYHGNAMATNTITYTLYKNGSATALTKTIAAGATTDTVTGSVSVSPTDVLMVTSQQSSTEANTTIRARVSLELT